MDCEHRTNQLCIHPTQHSTTWRSKPLQKLPKAQWVKLKTCASANMDGFWQGGSHDTVTPPPCTWCAALFPFRQPLSRLPPQSAVKHCGAAAGSQSRYPGSSLNERPAASTFYNSPPPQTLLWVSCSLLPHCHPECLSVTAQKLIGGLKPGERTLYLLQAIWKCCSANAWSRLCFPNKTHQQTSW